MTETMPATYGVSRMLLPVVVLAVMVFLIVRATRGNGAFRALATRRPRKRRLVTRIVCGSLGGLILLAVAIGTFREVGRVYAGREAQDIPEVSLPTLPSPTPEAPADGFYPADLRKVRVLFHLLIGEVTGDTFVPVRVFEHDIRLPDDAGKLLADDFEVDGFQGRSRARVSRAEVVKDEDGRRVRLDGGVSFGWRTTGSSSYGRGNYHDADSILEEAGVHGLGTRYWRRPRRQAPLSVLPSAESQMHAVYIVTVVHLDDPLKKAPVSELVRLHAREIEVHTRVRVTWRRDADIPMPGLALVAHIGASALLLVGAAGLLSQVFARRLLAFAGTLAGVVLFVAVLDRAALGSHLSRVEDREAPLGTRMTGCMHSADTFFYRGTAASRLLTVLEDDATPEPLRDLAGEVEIELDRSPIGRSVGYFVGYPTQHYRDVPKLTEFDLDELAPVLERRFPVRLSTKALGRGESGIWIACRKIDDGDASIPVLRRVAFVSWRDGRVTRAVQAPELVAAFAHGGHVYLHWWEELTGYRGMYLVCDADGWSQISDFSFARVRRGDVDESKLKLRPLVEYGKLIDRAGDELRDGVALYDVEVLAGEREGRLQSVVEFR
jgi:hypothetical protein